jgi:hypothetical protein
MFQKMGKSELPSRYTTDENAYRATALIREGSRSKLSDITPTSGHFTG